MRKFLSSSSDAVTKSATHIMRQAKAAALANAIKETQEARSGRTVGGSSSTGSSGSNAVSPAPAPSGPRPLVGISSPLNRGATVLAQKSRSEWLASRQEDLYTMQKPLSAAELYRQARFSGQITPSLAINEIGAEGPKTSSGSSAGSSGSGSSNLPHYLFYSMVLTLTGAAAWLCLDHTPLHTSGMLIHYVCPAQSLCVMRADDNVSLLQRQRISPSPPHPSAASPSRVATLNPHRVPGSAAC